MVDMWLLFSLSIPFSEVILHTKMEQLKQKLKKLDDVKNAWTKEKDQLTDRKKKIENNLRCIFFYLDVIRVKFLLCKKNGQLHLHGCVICVGGFKKCKNKLT